MSEQEIEWRIVTAEEAVSLHSLGVRHFQERRKSPEYLAESDWHNDGVFVHGGDPLQYWPIEELDGMWEFRVKVE